MNNHAKDELEYQSLPIFYEQFSPSTSRFDSELDEIVKQYALTTRTIHGFCNLSASETDFEVSSDNLRENIVASTSQSINRQRTIVCGLSQAFFGSPYASLAQVADHINQNNLRIYSAEANSTLFLHLKNHVQPELFSYSEFFGAEYTSGDMVNGVMHQDLQSTSFAPESLDLVMTSEVLEHIPDALTAEREVIRILKRGGIYCFTVPFLPYHEHDLILAEVDEAGSIKHLSEPQYHGDPVRPDQGILVYRIFSFNDLKERFESLGCSFLTYRFWSKSLGILDNNAWVHVVKKGVG
jgi:SAM-dependent methyltransferase